MYATTNTAIRIISIMISVRTHRVRCRIRLLMDFHMPWSLSLIIRTIIMQRISVHHVPIIQLFIIRMAMRYRRMRSMWMLAIRIWLRIRRTFCEVYTWHEYAERRECYESRHQFGTHNSTTNNNNPSPTFNTHVTNTTTDAANKNSAAITNATSTTNTTTTPHTTAKHDYDDW